MVSFENDYSEGAHPSVLKHLVDTNNTQQSGYGFDEYTKSAKQRICNACETPKADVFFLVGGTQTNATVIDAMLRSFEGVVAVETGHVALHEAGAIEHSGHKVLTIAAHNGKMWASDLDEYMKTYLADDSFEHMVNPGMVYISHPTEYGTLYTANELKEIAEVCRNYHLPLYLDGARLGYALAARNTDVTLPLLASLCDVFYIGGTKVGALCGEAVVFPKGAPLGFFTMVKQHGALLAKGRLVGVQFDALFTDNLYKKIGGNAIEMAELLKHILKSKQIPFFLESPTNQQFVILENTYLEELQKRVKVSFWEKYDETHSVVRFATSWATTREAVNLLNDLL